MRRKTLWSWLLIPVAALLLAGCDSCPPGDQPAAGEGPPPPDLDVEPAGGGEGPPSPPDLSPDPEGGEGPPSPPDLSPDPEGGGEGSPGEPTTYACSGEVKWNFSGRAGVPGPAAGGAINKDMRDHAISRLMGQGLAGPMRAIKAFEVKLLSSHDNAQHVVTATRVGNHLEWRLDGASLDGRDPVIHDLQLPAEFFGECQEFKLTRNGQDEPAKKTLIDWP